MNLHTALVITHLIGLVLGVGTASASDYLLIKCVLKGSMSKGELASLKTISTVVIAGIIILLVTGLAFLVESVVTSSSLLENPKVWAKLTITVIIAINGYILHKKVIPLLAENSDKPFFSGRFAEKAVIIFTAGAVSVTSWYTNLFLGALRQLNFVVSYASILTVYLILLSLAIISSNLMGYWLYQRFRKSTTNRLVAS